MQTYDKNSYLDAVIRSLQRNTSVDKFGICSLFCVIRNVCLIILGIVVHSKITHN